MLRFLALHYDFMTKSELENEDIEAVEGKTPSQRVGYAVKYIKHITLMIKLVNVMLTFSPLNKLQSYNIVCNMIYL